MSRTRVMVAGRPQWQDDGPAYARRQGFGGAAIGHYQTTFLVHQKAARGSVDPAAANHRSAAAQRAVERKRAYRARARALVTPSPSEASKGA